MRNLQFRYAHDKRSHLPEMLDRFDGLTYCLRTDLRVQKITTYRYKTQFVNIGLTYSNGEYVTLNNQMSRKKTAKSYLENYTLPPGSLINGFFGIKSEDGFVNSLGLVVRIKKSTQLQQ